MSSNTHSIFYIEGRGVYDRKTLDQYLSTLSENEISKLEIEEYIVKSVVSDTRRSQRTKYSAPIIPDKIHF